MAIKDFIIKDSYSRIERVDVMKEISTVDFYLTTYKDSSMNEVIVKNMRYSFLNNNMAKECECVDAQRIEGVPCLKCNDTRYIAQLDYDNFFKDALKSDVNIIGICYNILKAKPEFANTTEV